MYTNWPKSILQIFHLKTASRPHAYVRRPSWRRAGGSKVNNHTPYALLSIYRIPLQPYTLYLTFYLPCTIYLQPSIPYIQSTVYHLPSTFFHRPYAHRPSSSEQTSKYNFARAMGNRNASKRAANFSSLSLGDKFDLIIYKCRVRCKQTFHIGSILNGRTGRMH